MFEKSNQTSLNKNKDVVLLIKGLIIGKVLTLLVIGGLLWWLKPQLWSSATATNQTSENTVATNGSTYDRTTGVPSGTFNYGGSAAWIPIRQVVDAQIQQARPELQLRYVQPPNGNLSSSLFGQSVRIVPSFGFGTPAGFNRRVEFGLRFSF